MPDEEAQLRLGQLAVQRSLVTPDQLAEAIDEFRKRRSAGSQVPLGDLLVEFGYMTRSQLETLLKAQGGKKGPRSQIPGFELIRKLGEGGMGATYLARQVSMDRMVAIKVLRGGLSRNEKFVARFRREARVAGKLDHTNIVKAMDVGEASGFHYLVMEYVEGKTLADLLPDSGGMDERQALQAVVQIARALELAHSQGFIHRDIKPQNILVDVRGTAKLCDFGLARQAGDSSLTQAGGPTTSRRSRPAARPTWTSAATSTRWAQRSITWPPGRSPSRAPPRRWS
ncbi:MAG: serine/threonine-protein kinase [Planctomycetota bacterium]|jgi:serine/threonine-protein kinase